jgi:hypothetical protein
MLAIRHSAVMMTALCCPIQSLSWPSRPADRVPIAKQAITGAATPIVPMAAKTVQAIA